uniref:DUF4252 domain-containing protein n=1 Tax=Roseihalotalea indica TaxID=2867963 RepID=A0AA49JFS6_9BACT|nr:DUF4252 domain-containing protein [Tunicatimonas sp. TK19036]
MSKFARVGRLKKPLLLTLLIILVGFSFSIAQSHTVSRFLADHTPSQKLFFYPSTLRMVNIEKNPDFYALVRDVDKLRVLMYDKSSSGFSSQTLRDLSQDVKAEDYQELMTFETTQQTAYLYSLGDENTPEGVVGLIETDDTIILTDLEGFVNLPALLKLFQSDFNFEDMSGLVNIMSQQHKENKENGGGKN